MRRVCFSLVLLQVLCVPAAAARAPQTTKPATRSATLDRAAAELAAGRLAEAAVLYQSAADRFGSVHALLELARIQSRQARPMEALDTLAKARTLAPNSEDVLSASARASLANRLVIPAILALQPLARMCPDVSEYHYLLGVAFMQAGEMILSAESLQRADQLEPNKPLTLIAKGFVLNNRKMFEEAAVALNRALELEPESLEAMAAIAESEQGLGEAENAEAHARRVLERAPHNATANLVLGQLLMRNGDFAGARDALLRAAEADPHSPTPDYQLSLAYARLGDAAASERHRQLYERKLREMGENLEELRKRMGLPGKGGMG